jgi:hypothetical protein
MYHPAIPREFAPLTTQELEELERMIVFHGRAARVQRDTGFKWGDKTIPHAEMVKKLVHFRDRAIAMRN